MIITLIQKKRNAWKAFKEKLKKKNKWLGDFIDLAESLLVAFLIVWFIVRPFIVMTSLVPTPSMVPTLNVRDRLFVTKYDYRFRAPKRGEIIVFKSPSKDGKDYVKRCIGLPGETVEIKKGWVYIDGKLLILTGVNIQRDYFYAKPVKIPEGHFYVLGDNRNHSWDSRFWGFVPRKDIIGKAQYTFWPFSRMRVLR